MSIFCCGDSLIPAWIFQSKKCSSALLQVDAFFAVENQRVQFLFLNRVLCRLQGITSVCLKALSLPLSFLGDWESFLFSVLSYTLWLGCELFPCVFVGAFSADTCSHMWKGTKMLNHFQRMGANRVVGRTGRKSQRPNVWAVSLDKKSRANKSAFHDAI